jgi:saccharopine dehydrogenase-like NADP-dependent oxidoreductase
MEMWASYTVRPPFSAVARDTGFPAAVVAVMLGRGEIGGTGVEAPEIVVPPEPLFAELAKRGFQFRRWQSRPRAA